MPEARRRYLQKRTPRICEARRDSSFLRLYVRVPEDRFGIPAIEAKLCPIVLLDIGGNPPAFTPRLLNRNEISRPAVCILPWR